MMNKPSATTRYHGLDLLRSIAMILGLVFHAPILYYIPDMANGMQDFGVSKETIPEIEPWLNGLILWIHSWRMPVFFTLAGFFSMRMLERKSVRRFMLNRMVRLGLCMVLVAFFIDMLDGQFHGKLEHMWFLYYLLMITALFALVVGLVKSNLALFTGQSLLVSAVSLLVIIVAFTLVANYLGGGNFGIASSYVQVNISGLIYYSAWFVIGVWLFLQRSYLSTLSSTFELSVMAILALLSSLYTLQFSHGIFGMDRVEIPSLAILVKESTMQGLNSAAWVGLLIGLTHRFCTSDNWILRTLVELSYPIYLFHYVPVLIISATLIGHGFTQFQVLIFTSLTAFIVSCAIYYVAVKFTPLSWLINGYHKSWLQLSSKVNKKS